MTTIIDADSAKLAGLQIDLLQKVRQGHVTLDHLRWFNGLSKNERDSYTNAVPTLVSSSDSGRMFMMVADLGNITVPKDYVHGDWLTPFARRHIRDFLFYNSDVTDANFSNPSRILKPGDELSVRVFRQKSGTSTYEQRLAFLKREKAVLVGAQGATLVWEQKRDRLPSHELTRWYESLDERERLWRDTGDSGCYKVPGICVFDPTGGFRFDLRNFEAGPGVTSDLLCFSDVHSSSPRR